MSDSPTPPSKMERLTHIMGIMARGEWRTRVTELELVALWGAKLNTVRRDAEEANRMLKFDRKDLEVLQHQQAAFLERLQHDAISRRNTITGLPDYKSALEATKMTYEYVLGVSQKKDREPDPATVSDDDLRRLAKAAVKVIESSEKKTDERAQDPVPDPRPEGE